MATVMVVVPERIDRLLGGTPSWFVTCRWVHITRCKIQNIPFRFVEAGNLSPSVPRSNELDSHLFNKGLEYTNLNPIPVGFQDPLLIKVHVFTWLPYRKNYIMGVSNKHFINRIERRTGGSKESTKTWRTSIEFKSISISLPWFSAWSPKI